MNSLSCCLHWACSLFWEQLGALSYLYHLGPTQYNLYGFLLRLSGQDRTEQSSAFRVPFSASMLISRARITEEMDQPAPQPHFTVAACSVAGLALLNRDKTAWGPQGENLSLTASLWMSGTFSVMWLCDDHIVSLQTPKTKIREWTGEKEDNWEDTFYTLLWVLQ